MKLQELLDKHKDKLWDWWYNQLVIDPLARENYQWIIIDWRVNDNPMSEFSLCDLLFDTSFLNLLKRKSNKNEILIRTEFEWLISPLWYNDKWEQIRCYWDTYQYHKITLALLPDDKSRVEYIEQFTLTL